MDSLGAEVTLQDIGFTVSRPRRSGAGAPSGTGAGATQRCAETTPGPGPSLPSVPDPAPAPAPATALYPAPVRPFQLPSAPRPAGTAGSDQPPGPSTAIPDNLFDVADALQADVMNRSVGIPRAPWIQRPPSPPESAPAPAPKPFAFAPPVALPLPPPPQPPASATTPATTPFTLPPFIAPHATVFQPPPARLNPLAGSDESKLEAADTLISDLRVQLQQERAVAQQQQAEVAGLQANVARLQQELTSVHGRAPDSPPADGHQEVLEALEADLRAAKRDADVRVATAAEEHLASAAALQAEIAQLRAHILRLQADTTAQDEVLGLRERVKDLTTKLDSMTDARAELMSTLAAALAREAAARRHHTTQEAASQAEIARLQADLARLQEDAEGARLRLQATSPTAEVRQLREDAVAMKAGLARAFDSHADAARDAAMQRSALQTQLEQANAAVQAAASDAAALRDQLAEVAEQLVVQQGLVARLTTDLATARASEGMPPTCALIDATDTSLDVFVGTPISVLEETPLDAAAGPGLDANGPGHQWLALGSDEPFTAHIQMPASSGVRHVKMPTPVERKKRPGGRPGTVPPPPACPAAPGLLPPLTRATALAQARAIMATCTVQKAAAQMTAGQLQDLLSALGAEYVRPKAAAVEALFACVSQAADEETEAAPDAA